MTTYTLNKTPTKTSVNYGINNIKLDLDIPKHKKFENMSIYTSELDKMDIDIIDSAHGIKPELNSKIGLKFKQYEQINITIPENTTVRNPVLLDFLFDEESDYLVDNIQITMKPNSNASFILHYCNDSQNKFFHNLKQTTILEENSQANIVIANMLNNNSQSFISIENDIQEKAKLTHVLVEFGGENKISNYYSKIEGNNGENYLKSIYLGTGKDLIDINYNIEAIGKNTKCNIDVQGVITDNATKHFKGIIDFKEGAKKAEGVENENCMILSDNAKSKSLPMLLCNEEDVNGEHGVSSGKLDEQKLFYIMTKGISYEDARKLIIKANMNDIITEIPDEDLKLEVTELIDAKI